MAFSLQCRKPAAVPQTPLQCRKPRCSEWAGMEWHKTPILPTEWSQCRIDPSRSGFCRAVWRVANQSWRTATNNSHIQTMTQPAGSRFIPSDVLPRSSSPSHRIASDHILFQPHPIPSAPITPRSSSIPIAYCYHILLYLSHHSMQYWILSPIRSHPIHSVEFQEVRNAPHTVFSAPMRKAHDE